MCFIMEKREQRTRTQILSENSRRKKSQTEEEKFAILKMITRGATTPNDIILCEVTDAEILN